MCIDKNETKQGRAKECAFKSKSQGIYLSGKRAFNKNIIQNPDTV
jgi:hypothetical protein